VSNLDALHAGIEARKEAERPRIEALASIGYGPPITTGTGGFMGMLNHEATYCLTCGAMVPLLPIDEDAVDQPLEPTHPLMLHQAWHKKNRPQSED
jgi:hypothetical protein